MANNNKMNVRRPQQRGSMFFENMIKEFGEDFINKAQPLQMTRKSHLLFKDFAMGNINIEKHGKYFQSPQFVSLMQREALKKRFYYGTHVNGLRMVAQYTPDNASSPLFSSIMNDDLFAFNGYEIIDEGLKHMLATQDVSIIPVMANKLAPFRYKI